VRELLRKGAAVSDDSLGRGVEALTQRMTTGGERVHGSLGDAAAGASIRDVALGAAHDLANLFQVMGFGIEQLSGESLSPSGEEAIRSFRAELTYLRAVVRTLRAAATETPLTVKLPSATKADVQLADAGKKRSARSRSLGGNASAAQHKPRTYLAAWWPEMSELLHAVHGKEVAVRAELSWTLPPLGIRADHLTQIVLNLIGNSVHAIQERVVIGTDGPKHWPTVGITAQLSEDGSVVHLAVRDNGLGMSEEVLARACEPLFTTRRDVGGSGLGLAMVQRLTAEAGGRMSLRSERGAGTTVTLELPVKFSRVLVAVSATGRSNVIEPGMES